MVSNRATHHILGLGMKRFSFVLSNGSYGNVLPEIPEQNTSLENPDCFEPRLYSHFLSLKVCGSNQLFNPLPEIRAKMDLIE